MFKGEDFLMIDIDEINAEYIDQLTAAKILNISRSRINKLCNTGRFEGATKVGWSWLIPRVAVENFTRLKSGPKPKTTSREDDKALIAEVLAKVKGEL